MKLQIGTSKFSGFHEESSLDGSVGRSCDGCPCRHTPRSPPNGPASLHQHGKVADQRDAYCAAAGRGQYRHASSWGELIAPQETITSLLRAPFWRSPTRPISTPRPIVFNQDAGCIGRRDDRQIGPPSHIGRKKGPGCAHAPSILHGELENAGAFLLMPVEIWVLCKPNFSRPATRQAMPD